MRYMWAIVCALLLFTSSPAYTGGMSGGTGIGGLIQEITEEIQALLKNPIKLDAEMVRRLLMRLWVYGEADLKIGDKIIHIKWKYKTDYTKDPDALEITVISVHGTIEATTDGSNLNKNLLEIVKENIKFSADFGEDKDGDGELGKDEDENEANDLED